MGREASCRAGVQSTREEDRAGDPLGGVSPGQAKDGGPRSEKAPEKRRKKEEENAAG